MRARVLLVLVTALWAVSASAKVPSSAIRDPRSKSANDCVIVAVEKERAVHTAARLQRANVWARVLLVMYAGGDTGHAFCVFQPRTRICAYDASDGTVDLPITSRDPCVIAAALGQRRRESIIYGRFLK